MFRKPLTVQFLLVVFAAVAFSSCASYFKRKECENTNWFEFGEKVAMSGKRLTGNEFIRQCEKAEAQINYGDLDQGFKKGMATYCLPDTAYATGRKGNFFSEGMCEGSNLRLLKQRHTEGVRAYCDKSNGRAAGGSGQLYNNICPKDLEPEFLVEFNKGRKQFLRAKMNQNEREIQSLQNEIYSLEGQRANATVRLAALGDGKRIKNTHKFNPETGEYQNETKIVDDPDVERMRGDIHSTISNIESHIFRNRQRQQELRDENMKLATEIATL